MLETIAIQPHLWIIPIVILTLALAGAFWFFFLEEWFGDGFGGWQMVGVILWALGGILAIVYLFLLLPYNSKYHVLYRLSGTIHVETNRFTAGTGDLSYSPVAYLDGYDDPIVINSSRVMTLDGRDVDLTCTIAWEPYGLDTTYCELAAIR